LVIIIVQRYRDSSIHKDSWIEACFRSPEDASWAKELYDWFFGDEPEKPNGENEKEDEKFEEGHEFDDYEMMKLIIEGGSPPPPPCPWPINTQAAAGSWKRPPQYLCQA